MRYAESGSPTGDQVLFVHGAPGSWRDWNRCLKDPPLVQRFRMAAVDRRGFGASLDRPFRANFLEKVETLTEFAQAWARPEQALYLVGHSYGAALAAALSFSLAGRFDLRGALLVSGVYDPALHAPNWKHRWALRRPVRWLVPDRYLRGCSEMLQLLPGLQWLESRWKAFPCPLGIVHGTADWIAPVANAAFLCGAVDARCVFDDRLAGIGHRVPHNQPDRVGEALLKLSRVERGVLA